MSFLIPNGLVTEEKLGDGSVTTEKLAPLNYQQNTITAFSTASTAYQATGLTVTLNSGGRQVFIGLIPQGAGASSATHNILITNTADQALGILRILRDGTAIADFTVGIQAEETSGSVRLYLPISFFTIDQAASGNHTYTVSVRCDIASLIAVNNCKLVAFPVG